MSTVVEFPVLGNPAPQGSKRHVGGGRMVESSNAVKPWREAVKWAIHQSVDGDAFGAPFAGPVLVSLTFTLPKPASAPKTRRTYPSKRPDLDKLIRATLDGIGESGLWVDDAQVIGLEAVKAYPGDSDVGLPTPGVVVRIEQVPA